MHKGKINEITYPKMEFLLNKLCLQQVPLFHGLHLVIRYLCVRYPFQNCVVKTWYIQIFTLTSMKFLIVLFHRNFNIPNLNDTL